MGPNCLQRFYQAAKEASRQIANLTKEFLHTFVHAQYMSFSSVLTLKVPRKNASENVVF